MNIANMTQEQKDELLNRFLNAEAAKVRLGDYSRKGLSWTKNGFIAIKQGKAGDKSLPSLYVHPGFLSQLIAIIPDVQAFASDSAAKSLKETE